MYFPYLRGRQFELLALRELLENNRISEKIIPIIEPIKPSSTLLKTLQVFSEKRRNIAVVLNPGVGDFMLELEKLVRENAAVAKGIQTILCNDENIIKAYIMTDDIVTELKQNKEIEKFMIINSKRDGLDLFLDVYDTTLPAYVLIPDDRAYRRTISDSKVLFEDCFQKKARNVDYVQELDEFFSDTHMYFKNENYIGFSDYSIVGKEFNESGFAPTAVAIHVVYFTDKGDLRIRHFVSDRTDGVEDTSGKFGEALEKLVYWCDEHQVKYTLGLNGFYECFNTGKYPGLGTVKKYSIMHHIELISDYLGD